MNKNKMCPTYSLVGLLILIVGEILLFKGIRPVTWLFTPMAWTGYILLIDGIIWLREGKSLIRNRSGEFLIMLPLSVICWLVFEIFNLHIQNWHYEGLPEILWLRWLGYGWSFATIFPAIFETAELIESFGLNLKNKNSKSRIPSAVLWIFLILGICFLGIPLILPTVVAQYLAAFIWIGFIFLLEPINYWIGARSLLKEWEYGKYNKLLHLLMAGLICGFLWEFWNYWAESRWVYDVPICQNIKIFEMVLPGYLGFLPFAVECYLMYHFFLRLIFGKSNRLFI